MSETEAERQERLLAAEAQRDARLRAAAAKERARQAAKQGENEPPVLRTGKGLTDGGTEQ